MSGLEYVANNPYFIFGMCIVWLVGTIALLIDMWKNR